MADGSVKIDTSIDKSKLEKDLDGIKRSLTDAGKTFEKIGGSSEAAFKKITEEFTRLEKNAKAFGDASEGAAEKKKYLKKQIESLIKEGMSPESEEIKTLSKLYQSLDSASRTSGQIRKQSFESVLSSIDSYENAVGVLNAKLKDGFIDEKKQKEEIIELTKKQIDQLYAVGASLDNASSTGHDALKKMTADLKNMEKEAAKSTKTLADIKKEIQEAGKISGQALKYAAGAAGVLTAALGAAAAGYTQTADRIDKMSQSLSVSRDTFQKLDYVFSQNGASIDNFGSGIKSLQAQIEKTAKSTDKQSTALGQLGISVTNANGQLKTQDEILLETLYAFNDIEEGIEKSRLANELFGKSAQDLMPLLNQQAGSIEGLVARAEELGLVMGDDAVNNGVALGDALDDLKSAGKALLNEAIAPLIPIVTESINNFIDWAKEGDRLKNGISTTINVFKVLIPVLAAASAGLAAFFLIAKGKAIIMGLAGAVKILTAAIAANPIGAIAALITAVLIPALIALYKNWDKVVSFFRTSVVKLEVGFKTGISNMKIVMLQFVNSLQKDLIRKLANLLDLLGQIPGVGKGFQKAAAFARGLSGTLDDLIKKEQEESRQAIITAQEKLKAIEAEKNAIEETAEVRENATRRALETTTELTEAEKALIDSMRDHRRAVDLLDRKLKDGYINQKSYNEELISLTQKQIDALYNMGYSLQDVSSAGGQMLQGLINKFEELNNSKLIFEQNLESYLAQYGVIDERGILENLIKEQENIIKGLAGDKLKIEMDLYLPEKEAIEKINEIEEKILECKDLIGIFKIQINEKEILNSTDDYNKAISVLNNKLKDGLITEEEHRKEIINLTQQQIDKLYEMGYSIEDTTGLIISAGGQALKDFQNTLDSLTGKRSFSNFIENLFKNANEETRKKVSDWAGTTGKAIDDSINKIIPAIKRTVKQIGEAISNGAAVIKKVAQVFQTIGSTAKAFLEKGFKGITSFISGLFSGISALAKFDPAALYESLEETIAGLDKFFSETLGTLPIFFNMATTSINKFLDDTIKELPRIEETLGNVISSICKTITEDGPVIIEKFLDIFFGLANTVLENSPEIIKAFDTILKSFITNIKKEGPKLVKEFAKTMVDIINTILKNLPDIFETALLLIESLLEGIEEGMPELMKTIGDIIPKMINTLVDKLPGILNMGINIINELVRGITSNIGAIVQGIAKIIVIIINTIVEHLPEILEIGIELFLQLVLAIIEVLPMIIMTIIEVIPKIIEAILGAIPQLLEAVGQIIGALIQFIIENTPNIVAAIIRAIPQIIAALIDSIPDILVAVQTMVLSIIGGLFTGLSNGIGNLNIADMFDFNLSLPDLLKKVAEFATKIVKGLFNSLKDNIGKMDFASLLNPLNLFSDSSSSSSNKGSSTGSNVLAVATGGISKLFGFATGTESAPPGFAVVGEEGPELLQFKGGERIYPADETASILSGAGMQSILKGISSFSGVNIPAPVLQPQAISINNKMTGSLVVDGREIGRIAFEHLDYFAKAAYGN